uniref:Uncharacterized protein n=1 Tax=Opuntia streptacantha TaxID=393608 RepID=A0A7C9AFM5_OPUST
MEVVCSASPCSSTWFCPALVATSEIEGLAIWFNSIKCEKYLSIMPWIDTAPEKLSQGLSIVGLESHTCTGWSISLESTPTPLGGRRHSCSSLSELFPAVNLFALYLLFLFFFFLNS